MKRAAKAGAAIRTGMRVGERESDTVAIDRGIDHGPGRAARAGERGVALLLALLTMVLLAVVVIEFTVATQVGYRRAAMWAASRRAAHIAEAGVVLAGEVLRQDFQVSSTDSLADIWAREVPPIDTGAGMLAVRIEDESGRMNLNDLAAGSLSPPGRRFQVLLSRLGLEPGLAAPLADWVDRNREPGPGALAAEDSWYLQQTPPYRPRNGPLRSWAELALVRGFTPVVLARLRPHATVVPDNDTRVNVNTATAEVLASMDPRLDDPALVRRILDLRVTQPFARASALKAALGVETLSEAELDRLFRFSSRWFRVRATGDVDGAMRSADATIERVEGVPRIVHLLPRRGPNIVGLDSGIRARIDDAAWLGSARR